MKKINLIIACLFSLILFSCENKHDPQREDNSLKNRFRIPMVIYAPKLLKPQKIDHIVTQNDLIPTIYRLTELNHPYTAFGRDMFDSAKDRVALVSDGVTIGLVTPEGEIRHGGGKVLYSQAYTPDFDVKKAEEKLLSLDKTAHTLLTENLWYDASYDVKENTNGK